MPPLHKAYVRIEESEGRSYLNVDVPLASDSILSEAFPFLAVNVESEIVPFESGGTAKQLCWLGSSKSKVSSHRSAGNERGRTAKQSCFG